MWRISHNRVSRYALILAGFPWFTIGNRLESVLQSGIPSPDHVRQSPSLYVAVFGSATGCGDGVYSDGDYGSVTV